MGALRTLLLANLDPVVQAQLAATLAAEDRVIQTAGTTADALAQIEARPFDLIVANAGLLDSLASANGHARVIVVHPAPTPESIVAAIRRHVYACVPSPFPVESLADLAEAALHDTDGDDIEVLSAKPDWLTLRLRCRMDAADRILPFVQGLSTGLGEPEQLQIATAFREILLNAIEHGGRSDPRNKVTITFARSHRALYYYVRDPGPGFSFEKLTHAAVANESPIEHVRVREELGMRPGGYGLLMTRQLVDEMIHNEAGNEVILIKYLPTANEDSRTVPPPPQTPPEPRE